MARPSIADDMKTFLLAIPRQCSVGNIALRAELGWSEPRYWRIHSQLVENGRIIRGRGRGGTVRRFKRSPR